MKNVVELSLNEVALISGGVKKAKGKKGKKPARKPMPVVQKSGSSYLSTGLNMVDYVADFGIAAGIAGVIASYIPKVKEYSTYFSNKTYGIAAGVSILYKAARFFQFI